MWVFVGLAVVGICIVLFPSLRRNEGILLWGALAIVVSTWIDKGMGLVVGGFVPNPFEKVVEYTPTVPELAITIGVWAIGFLILTVLYKVAVTVKEEAAG
jgi:molybdopterin-containing oxidoreductase family membrane subunit